MPRRPYSCSGKPSAAMKAAANRAFCAEEPRFCSAGRPRAPAGCKVVYFRKRGCRSAVAVLRCEDPGGLKRAAQARWNRMTGEGDICLKKRGRFWRISSRGCSARSPRRPVTRGRRRRRR